MSMRFRGVPKIASIKTLRKFESDADMMDDVVESPPAPPLADIRRFQSNAPRLAVRVYISNYFDFPHTSHLISRNIRETNSCSVLNTHSILNVYLCNARTTGIGIQFGLFQFVLFVVLLGRINWTSTDFNTWTSTCSQKVESYKNDACDTRWFG